MGVKWLFCSFILHYTKEVVSFYGWWPFGFILPNLLGHILCPSFLFYFLFLLIYIFYVLEISYFSLSLPLKFMTSFRRLKFWYSPVYQSSYKSFAFHTCLENMFLFIGHKNILDFIFSSNIFKVVFWHLVSHSSYFFS